MYEFSTDEARRWDTWQQANALNARRSDVICRILAVAVLATLFIALAIVVRWR
jgi:hypothetical protein